MLVELSGNEQTIVDPKDAAQSVGLRYVSDARPGIRRRKSGKGFLYTRVDGSRLSEPVVAPEIIASLQRIEPFHHIGHVDCLCVGVHESSRFGPFAWADRSAKYIGGKS